MNSGDLKDTSAPMVHYYVDQIKGPIGYALKSKADKMANGRVVHSVPAFAFKGELHNSEWLG